MASLRRLGNLAGTFLDDYLQRKRMSYQSDLVAQRQQELAHQAMVQKMLENVSSNPQFAARLRDQGMSNIAGIPTEAFLPSRDENLAAVGKGITAAKTPQDIPDPISLLNQFKSQPGAQLVQPGPTQIDPRTGLNQPHESAMQTLLDHASAAKQGMINNARPIEAEAMVGGIKHKQLANPFTGAQVADLGGMERTPVEEGQRQATIAGLEAPGKVKLAGAEAAARSAAEFPWQLKLAKARFENQEAMAQWKMDHPAATAYERNTASKAIAAQGAIGEMRAMLGEMDKRGMMGVLASRGYDLAAGKIRSEDLFKNPDDAKLAANYFSSAKLLSSLAAVVHGGARGGGSVELTKKFEQILSGTGDPSIITGQLDALERLMKHYADHPGQPEIYDIPGVGGVGGQSASPVLDSARSKLGSR